MAQAEPTPAEQTEQAKQHSQPASPRQQAPAQISPAQTTPAAPAQPVAPEPTRKADMLAALLEFNRLHKSATLKQYLLLNAFMNVHKNCVRVAGLWSLLNSNSAASMSAFVVGSGATG